MQPHGSLFSNRLARFADSLLIPVEAVRGPVVAGTNDSFIHRHPLKGGQRGSKRYLVTLCYSKFSNMLTRWISPQI